MLPDYHRYRTGVVGQFPDMVEKNRIHKFTLHSLTLPQEAACFVPDPALPAFDAGALAIFPPDAQWAPAEGGVLAGRCSLWWTRVPAYGEHRLGLIGHYAARDAEAAGELLRHACAELAARGCTLAVGPLDGNTLRRYRFITERGSEPPFLLEPDNPDDWPGHWRAAGFTPLATYCSSLNADLAYEDPRIPAVEARLAAAGVAIRALQADDYPDELRRIYAVAAVSFRPNFLFASFTAEEFMALYLPLRERVRPELVLLAEHEGRPVGFMFNVPDLQQARRGEAVDTLILKTFAVLPGRTYAGLGNVLLARSHRLAREGGFRRVIHALMHEGNASLLISNRYARPFRRYSLFGRPLP